ncbi:uncharacterized protein J3D65DRAFT_176174 [Phyllosticta citribraziliensis]|uniref:Uncharacterized protein n=1 Tax=Phyllosticta citribraziliensis TaxID=989973 RepID=A0ABR1L232_9PEZI
MEAATAAPDSGSFSPVVCWTRIVCPAFYWTDFLHTASTTYPWPPEDVTFGQLAGANTDIVMALAPRPSTWPCCDPGGGLLAAGPCELRLVRRSPPCVAIDRHGDGTDKVRAETSNEMSEGMGPKWTWRLSPCFDASVVGSSPRWRLSSNQAGGLGRPIRSTEVGSAGANVRGAIPRVEPCLFQRGSCFAGRMLHLDSDQGKES